MSRPTAADRRARRFRLRRLRQRFLPTIQGLEGRRLLSYLQNFDTTAVGTVPTGWVNDANASVQADGFESSPNALTTTADVASSHWAYVDSNDDGGGNNIYRTWIDFTGNGNIAALMYRLTPNGGTSAADGYYVRVWPDASGAGYFQLVRGNGSNPTVLASAGTDGSNLPLNTSLRLTVVANRDHHQVELYRADTEQYYTASGTWSSTEQYCIDYTDTSASAISGAGRSGFFWYSADSSDPIEFDDFSITPLEALSEPAAASPNPVAGTTTSLTALGADASYPESDLTYTWSTTADPTGAPAPTFSINGTNAAQDTTVTFGQAGSYTFQVTITDPDSLTATSSVTVTVAQTLNTIAVDPARLSIVENATQSLMATASDQFGQALSSQPSFAWSVDSGGAGGTVSTSGLYTAPNSGTGNDTIRAASGDVSGTAMVFDVASAEPADGGFEAPAVGTGTFDSFSYGPTDTTWTYAGLSGVAGNDGGLTSGNPDAPGGTQVGFVQETGSFSQVVAGIAAGTYQITFDAAQRGNNGVSRQDFAVLVDGVVVDTFTPPGTSYAPYTTASFTVAAGSHTIAFQGLDSVGGDNAALIDEVGLTQATSARLADAGFEVPEVGTGTFSSFWYGPTDTTWTYAGLSGVAGNDGGLTSGNPDAPGGTQVGFVQETGSFSQVVAGIAAGTYQITFDAAQRGNNGVSRQDFAVLVDGVVVDTFTPPGTSYAPYTTASFTVAAGSHTIAFQGLDSVGGDNAALIDEVQLLQDIPSLTVATPAAASPNPVAGTTTSLTALGADASYLESDLTYTWATTSAPTEAPAPTFSVNGTNGAQDTTVTFGQAGTYTLEVTIADPGSLAITNSVIVTVEQTLSAIAVAPASATLSEGSTEPFAALALDQFGQALASQPTLTWSIDGGGAGGSVSTSGLYTAPGSETGSDTVRATSGTVGGTAAVTVLPSAATEAFLGTDTTTGGNWEDTY